MIHRAILGSVERMVAVLTESYAGKWPFWLSPRQVVVIPVHPSFTPYATAVSERLQAAGYAVDADTSDGTQLKRKIRNGQLAQYNFILVVGKTEESNNSVRVRVRDNSVRDGDRGEVGVDALLAHFAVLAAERRKSVEFDAAPDSAGAAPAAAAGAGDPAGAAEPEE